MIPVWSTTKIVQTVLIGCKSRLRGQAIGFLNAIFKNLLVQYLHGPERSYLVYNII